MVGRRRSSPIQSLIAEERFHTAFLSMLFSSISHACHLCDQAVCALRFLLLVSSLLRSVAAGRGDGEVCLRSLGLLLVGVARIWLSDDDGVGVREFFLEGAILVS